MSSLQEEEEKLVQMVHDFLEQDTETTISNPSSQNTHLNDTTCITVQGIIGSVTKAEMEVYNRVLVLLKYVRKMGNESSVKRMLMMWLRMDGYDAYLCKSSWDATFGRLGGLMWELNHVTRGMYACMAFYTIQVLEGTFIDEYMPNIDRTVRSFLWN